MAALSLDLRERIIERHRLGRETYKELAALFNVGEASVSRVLRRARERGNVMPDPTGGGFPPRIADDDLPKLEKLVAEKADRTIEELCAAWSGRYGGPITTSSMSRSLQRVRLTREKDLLRLRAGAPRRPISSTGVHRELYHHGAARYVYDASASSSKTPATAHPGTVETSPSTTAEPSPQPCSVCLGCEDDSHASFDRGQARQTDCTEQ